MNAVVLTAPQTFKFRFKKDKTGNQRPAFELPNVEVLTAEGVMDVIAKGGKGLGLLLETVAGVQRSACATIVGEDEKITAESFPYSRVTWEAIANQPARERTVIADETWESFIKEYLEIMPALTGKDQEQLGNACQVYLKKLTIIKSNKPLLEKLKGQLTIFVENTKKGEEFSDILELLMGRFDLYLSSNDVELIINNL